MVSRGRFRRTETPEEREERLGKRDAEIERLEGELNEAVDALKSSADWQGRLAIASKLYNYSFNNVNLIVRQFPDASLVASEGRWKRLGYSVLPGQLPIVVFAPVRRRIGTRLPSGEEVLFSEDDERSGTLKGKPIYAVVGKRPEPTFDITQTTARGLKLPRPDLLEGDAPRELWELLVNDLRETFSYDVDFIDRNSIGGANGVTTGKDKKFVYIANDTQPLQQLKTLIHEHGHLTLEHIGDYKEYLQHRDEFEVQAEAYANMVAGMAGINTLDYSIAYIAGWAGEGTEARKKCAEAVNVASWAAHDTIDRLPGLTRDAFLRTELAIIEAGNAAFVEKRAGSLVSKLAPVADAKIVISHSQRYGTEINGDTYPHRSIIGESKRFLYSKMLRGSKKPGWYVSGSQATPPNMAIIADLTEKLIDVGVPVALTGDISKFTSLEIASPVVDITQTPTPPRRPAPSFEISL